MTGGDDAQERIDRLRDRLRERTPDAGEARKSLVPGSEEGDVPCTSCGKRGCCCNCGVCGYYCGGHDYNYTRFLEIAENIFKGESVTV